MRICSLILIMLSVSVFGNDFIHGLPNGHFAGIGDWRDNLGGMGQYYTYVELRNNEMRVDYSWDDKQSLTVYMSFWFNNPGEFDVVYEGGIVGQGYCERYLCYYETYVNGEYFSERLEFDFSVDGSYLLSKTGSKILQGRSISWVDGLYAVSEESSPIDLPYPIPTSQK